MRKFDRFMYTLDPLDKSFIKALKRQGKFNRSITILSTLVMIYIWLNEIEKNQMRKRLAKLENHSDVKVASVVFQNKEKATQVLDVMRNCIRQYNVVSVCDYYDLAGIDSYDAYKFSRIGWNDLSDADVVATYGGWKLDLPEPKSIVDIIYDFYKGE